MLASGFDGLPNIIVGSLAEDLLPRSPISKPSLGPLDLFLLVQLLLLLLREERLLDLNLDLLDEGRLGVFLLKFVLETVVYRSMDPLLLDDLPPLAPVLTVMQSPRQLPPERSVATKMLYSLLD
jgi:hypothetical protein